MSDPEVLYLILGLVVGGAAGYGLRAYRSYLRRKRYRTSSAYHIHGVQGASADPKEGVEDPKATGRPGRT